MKRPSPLALRRIQQKLTQTEVAEAVKVSNQTVLYWESGAYTPGLRSFAGLVRLYRCSADDLLNDFRRSGHDLD